MKRKINHCFKSIPVVVRFITVCAVAGIMYCTMSPANNTSSIGGTGSEVVGVVKYPDSTAAAKARNNTVSGLSPVMQGSVYIHPRDFLADTATVSDSIITVTENDGYFSIRNVLPGEHLVYIRDREGNAVATTVNVPAESTTIDVGTLYAKKTAGVAIQYSGSTPGDVLFFIDVRGTGLQLRCTSRDLKVTLDKIPTGADIEHTVTVRIFKPVVRGYDISRINLIPAMIKTLESITGD